MKLFKTIEVEDGYPIIVKTEQTDWTEWITYSINMPNKPLIRIVNISGEMQIEHVHGTEREKHHRILWKLRDGSNEVLNWGLNFKLMTNNAEEKAITRSKALWKRDDEARTERDVWDNAREVIADYMHKEANR